MVHRGLLVLVLAACAPPGATGPAWPKAAGREVDGGESLAPRAAARTVAAAADASEDRAAAGPAADKSAASSGTTTGAGAADRSTTTLPATAPSDETIMTEEIVIEVEGTDDGH